MVWGYLNGRFAPLADIAISPLDRGFLFADGVYEVIPVYNGKFFRLLDHLHRLQASLAAIQLTVEPAAAQWETLLQTLLERSGGGDLSIYLQVTRGVAATRDHGFPPAATPTVFAMANPRKPPRLPEQGVAAVTLEDIRWHACHIKSTALLANVLARQQALAQGAVEAILIRDGLLTEGAASNVFVVRDNVLLTPPKNQYILAGITRAVILALATGQGIACREQALPVTALATAEEVWLTSSTKEILPVTRIDGQAVGTGRPGPLWRRLQTLLQDHIQTVCRI